jgi:hypothetical protein
MIWQETLNFLQNNWKYLFGFYIILSIGGYFFMRTYVRQCLVNRITPFNNSVVKMFFVSIVCGLVTTFVIIIGILLTIADFFKRNH